MQKLGDAFDRFVDHFSMRELKTRVRIVILVGLIMCAATLAGGLLLLSHSFFVADKPDLQAVPYFKMILHSPAP